MVGEVEVRRPRRQAEGRRRERALAGRDAVPGGARAGAEQACAQRSNVHIGDHRVGCDALAIGQLDPGDAPVLDHDSRHRRVGADRAALPLDQVGDRAREPAQAALDGPDACLLDMGDEHQRGRRLERRGAAIGGVAPEELAQARIAKILAECRPKCREGLDAPEAADPRQADALGEIDRARPVGADERAFQCPVDLRGAGAEAAIAVRLPCARKGADGVGRCIDIGEQIEPFALVPGVTGEQRGRLQPDFRLEAGAGLGEELVEHPAHREDGRACLDRNAANAD